MTGIAKFFLVDSGATPFAKGMKHAGYNQSAMRKYNTREHVETDHLLGWLWIMPVICCMVTPWESWLREVNVTGTCPGSAGKARLLGAMADAQYASKQCPAPGMIVFPCEAGCR